MQKSPESVAVLNVYRFVHFIKFYDEVRLKNKPTDKKTPFLRPKLVFELSSLFAIPGYDKQFLPH